MNPDLNLDLSSEEKLPLDEKATLKKLSRECDYKVLLLLLYTVLCTVESSISECVII